MIKQITIVLCFIVLLSNLAACSSSDGLTGRTISILDIIGTNATVTKADAKEYNAKKGLRLGADYGASTGDVTYVYFNLDDKSLAKMDEISKVSVAQISENKLRLNLVDGAILINERGKRAGDLEIRAGNIAIGIRGTFITAKYDGAGMTVFIIDGAIDVTTTSGDVTPVGSLKRVAVVNDVVTVTDLKWSMLDQFTRDCIMEYQGDLSGALSEDDFNAIFNRGNMITVAATVIFNADVYGSNMTALYPQPGFNELEPYQFGIRPYGALFNLPIQLPNGELVSEAMAWSNNNLLWREMGVEYVDGGSVFNEAASQKDVILTGYLYRNEDYTGEIYHEYIDEHNPKYDWSTGEYDNYVYEPNGPYNFEILSFEETEQ